MSAVAFSATAPEEAADADEALAAGASIAGQFSCTVVPFSMLLPPASRLAGYSVAVVALTDSPVMALPVLFASSKVAAPAVCWPTDSTLTDEEAADEDADSDDAGCCMLVDSEEALDEDAEPEEHPASARGAIESASTAAIATVLTCAIV
ncbi:MAG TPA: hypothetical protein DCP91_04135 [Eggerthellaceae bacterium]|nr:hypothetical protein [Eggerthellaceae bacterium]